VALYIPDVLMKLVLINTLLIVRTTITKPPVDASVIKGSTKTLQCKVSHDALVNVTWVWYHNNQTISASDRRRQIKKDGSLRITSVRNRDVGTYRCRVTSVGGNDSASAAIEIIGGLALHV